MPIENKSETIRRVCNALLAGKHDDAIQIAHEEYPFIALTRLPCLASVPAAPRTVCTEAATNRSRRVYTKYDLCSLFLRDGFIDRYTGEQLIFPPVFRLLSTVLPEAFPAHPNWKLSASHIVYWELFATLDHIQPIAAGGVDAQENWATTSMLRNMQKSDATLGELGWTIHPPGNSQKWAGLLGWFDAFVTQYPQHLQDSHLRQWQSAMCRTISTVP